MVDQKIPLSRAILWVLISTLLISGSAFMGWLYYLHVRDLRLHDDQYRIVALIQSNSQANALRTNYLAELLDLSLDRPTNLYQFNGKEGTQKLLDNPLIKAATIQKILPGTLYVDYEMRTPLAYVGDFANTFIDQEGFLFPFRPFFTPKHLPILYLGLEKEEYQWGSCVKHLSSVQLAFNLLCEFQNLQQEQFEIKQLDVMQAEVDSYGQRQVVLVLQEKKEDLAQITEKPLIFLRLNPDHAEQNLANFWTLQATLFEKDKANIQKEPSMTIDLRIPHLAFIKEER